MTHSYPTRRSSDLRIKRFAARSRFIEGLDWGGKQAFICLMLRVDRCSCLGPEMAAMKAVQSSMNDRIKAAIGAAALQGLFGYALITQLAVEMPVAASDALKLFEVLPKPPPRIEKITPPQNARASGRERVCPT